jgi:hypothetical protein
MILVYGVRVGSASRRFSPAPPATEAELRAALHASPERIIITKDEDNAHNAAGMRSSAPSSDDMEQTLGRRDKPLRIRTLGRSQARDRDEPRCRVR